MMRPQLRRFISGSTAWIAWKFDDRLIAMTASQRSGGKLSTGAVCWMPALLTRMSTPPSSCAAARTIAWISAGFEMSAPLKPTFTLNSSARPRRSFSMAAASPKPFSITFAPSAASARAIPSPMPLVEPVTSADLPLIMGPPG